MDDLKKLTLPKQLLAGGGIAVFIFSFFEWFSISVKGGLGGFGADVGGGNGWDVGFLWGGLPALAGLAAAAIVLLPVFNVSLPDGAPWDMIAAICGATGALVALKFLIGEDDGGYVEVSRSFGLFIDTLGGIAMCAGGVMTLMNQNKAAS